MEDNTITISENPSRDEYTSSPGQTVFNYTFKIYANTDLNVYVTPEGQEADDAADLTTAYTVDTNSIGDDAGGFITFNSPLADGDKVTILSNIPYNRTVDYQNNGDFRPDTVNSDNDRQVSQIKQIESGLSRTLQFPSSLQNTTGVSMDSPESGKYVRWKSDLSGLENVELPAGQVAANGVVLIYPDVATMKASTDDNLIPGITVATQGYYTAGDGGGALYLISTAQAADEYGDHTLANGNVAVLQVSGTVDVRQYGAKGDGVADDTNALNAIKDSGCKRFTLGGPSNIYLRTSNWQFDNDNSDIIIDFGGATIKTTSQFGIYIPAVGDGFSGVAGASNITIIDAVLDGVDSGASSVGIYSFNPDNLTVDNCKSNNWNLSGCVIAEVVADTAKASITNYSATGNGNHGIAVATLSDTASRVILSGIKCWSNGLGVDLSSGSATISNVVCWDNTNGGMKTSLGTKHLLLSNADFSNNTNAGAQGFYTNGDFNLIEMSNIRCNGNGSVGMQFAHKGTVLASNINVEGNGSIGFYLSAPTDVIVDTITAKSNTTRGLLIADGNCQIGNVRTELNTRVGILVSSTGVVSIGSHLSIDDCTSSDTLAISFQPATNEGRYSLSSAVAVNTGSGGVTGAVSINSNTEQATIGTIKTIGALITSAISDGGTNTVYSDADGRAKMPFSRIGFYGSAPLEKQSITGAKSGNAALSDLLTKLDSLGLIVDATT